MTEASPQYRAQRPLNPAAIARATRRAQLIVAEHLSGAQALATDKRKNFRLAIHECAACHYTAGRVVGHAFTPYRCANCEQDKMHSNTGVPIYCSECCAENNCCCRCGAELDPKPVK